jgi:hypothetical protein
MPFILLSEIYRNLPSMICLPQNAIVKTFWLWRHPQNKYHQRMQLVKKKVLLDIQQKNM